MQNALAPAGVDAARIEALWWLMFGICTVVFIAVLAFLAAGLLIRRREPEAGEETKTRVVAGAVGLTVILLIVILAGSVAVGRGTASGPDDALTIEVVGHQWWWEVRYLDPRADHTFTTANEIHLPVGERVRLRIWSQDVIHSLWIPQLAPKVDLLPGAVNTLWVEPTEPGEFRGQCAEFCGMQHAHMALVAVALPRDEFAAWLDRERQAVAPPADPLAERGLAAFETACSVCHRIRGTDALATFGPDLTHLGRRRTLAAGTVANTRAWLTAWIVDPQQIKPGSFMPPTNLDAETLHAMVHYLEQLR